MLSFSRTLDVEWGDCDPAAIVFFPRYLAWFDANTARLFAHAGIPKAGLLTRYDIIGVPLVDLQVRFLRPSRFGDTITIESAVKEFGRSSFKVAHRVLREGKAAVECVETRVWTGKDPDDPTRIRSMPIPQEVIDLLSADQAGAPRLDG